MTKRNFTTNGTQWYVGSGAGAGFDGCVGKEAVEGGAAGGLEVQPVAPRGASAVEGLEGQIGAAFDRGLTYQTPRKRRRKKVPAENCLI